MAGRPAKIVLATPRVSEVGAIRRLVALGVLRGELLDRTSTGIRASLGSWRVARRNGRIVGCVCLQAASSELAEIRSLTVERRFRGAGIGALLLEAALQLARDFGYRRVCATTSAGAIFARAGFKALPGQWTCVLSGTRPVRNGCVLMEKELQPKGEEIVQEARK